MNILMVYQGGEFPPAERIEKEAKVLTADGHKIFLLCNNYGKWDKHSETIGDVEVCRIRPTFKSVKLNKILKFPVFLNPLWIFFLFLIIWKKRISAVQVVDIPVGLAAVLAARCFGIPVILDMWEPYPEALRSWSKNDWKTLVFKNYKVAKVVEKITIGLVDRIFTVIDEQRDHLVSLGVSPNKIDVVPNTVDLETFVPLSTTSPAPGSFTLLYVGGISNERGLEDIISAAKLLRSDLPGLKVKIGGGGAYELVLKDLAKQEGVEDLVSFLGWIKFSDIPSLITAADLCLIPHRATESINRTIPNKLFQYMAMAKPVLVSDAKPLERVVNECRCGYAFHSGDPASAAKVILQASRDPERDKLGINGRAWIEQKYNWTLSSVPIIECYRRKPEALTTTSAGTD